MIAFNPAKVSIIYETDWANVKEIIINGASFCHVDKISALTQEIEVITEGNHMWHGAIPILSTRAISMRMDMN